MADKTPGDGTLTDLEYAKLFGRERIEDANQLGAVPQTPGVIGGLAGLARGASTLHDLIFGAKKLAKAQDMKDRQAALDELGKLDQKA